MSLKRFQWLDEVPDVPGRPLRVLLLADDRHVARVVTDHIRGIVMHSRHWCRIANPIHDPVPVAGGTPDFDVILIHYSLYVLGPYFLPDPWADYVRCHPAVKVQIIQDEYREINRMKARMHELGVRLVFSSLDPANAERVYGVGGPAGTSFVSCIPGYVHDHFDHLAPPPFADRPFDVVYRGRDLSPALGRMAADKSAIGKQVMAAARAHGLTVDIATDESSRVYGNEWMRFLSSGRATLGCEGGASIFDFDGSVASAVDAFRAAHPRAGTDETWKAVASRWEGNVVHRTITPRILESVAARTALVLYPGSYRGLIRPEEHYVELQRDGSNMGEVMRALEDHRSLEAMAERAWVAVMRNPRLRKRHYVSKLDSAITLALGAPEDPSGRAPPQVDRPSRSHGCLPRRRLLVAYSSASTFTVTTSEYVESFARELPWEVHFLHVTHGAKPSIDLSRYDCVLLSYCARLCFPGYVSPDFLSLLDGFEGVRAVCIQDEYDHVEHERQGLDRIRPHVVFTCIPPDQRERVYPSSRYPGTDFIQVLTGYVPASLVAGTRPVGLRDRPIAIGYRGRDIGPRYGRLASMKFGIGAAFRDAAQARGLPADIAMDESSRIYGKAWYDWLGRCRCVLGTESGSNVFDFDGSIAEACSRAGGAALPAHLQARIDELDRTFDMGQISPRVFEAAATRTALVLYEGRYSDAIRPHEHYVPVKHDHSNLDEVFAAISDVPALEAMVDRAHLHLIESGRFSYSAFASVVEQALDRHMSFPPRGGVAPVDLPITDPGRPALEERPTSSPRGFDSFQLRHLRAQYERPAGMARFIARSMLRPQDRRRVRMLRDRLVDGIHWSWHLIPASMRRRVAAPASAIRRHPALRWLR